MRKFLLILIGLLITVSCQKDFYLDELNDTRTELERTRANNNAVLVDLQAQLDAANDAMSDLADELTIQIAELVTANETNDALLDQVNGLITDLEAIQEVNDELEADIAATKAELDDALAATEVDDAQIAALVAHIEALQALYDELVANPIIQIQEVIRTVTNTQIQTETVTNTVYIDFDVVIAEYAIENTQDAFVSMFSTQDDITIVEVEGGLDITVPTNEGDGFATFNVRTGSEGLYFVGNDPDGQWEEWYETFDTYSDLLSFFEIIEDEDGNFWSFFAYDSVNLLGRDLDGNAIFEVVNSPTRVIRSGKSTRGSRVRRIVV